MLIWNHVNLCILMILQSILHFKDIANLCKQTRPSVAVHVFINVRLGQGYFVLYFYTIIFQYTVGLIFYRNVSLYRLFYHIHLSYHIFNITELQMWLTVSQNNDLRFSCLLTFNCFNCVSLLFYDLIAENTLRHVSVVVNELTLALYSYFNIGQCSKATRVTTSPGLRCNGNSFQRCQMMQCNDFTSITGCCVKRGDIVILLLLFCELFLFL